ncbi:hypothetical protein ACHAWF_012579 [Thalassiosira exigua]
MWSASVRALSMAIRQQPKTTSVMSLNHNQIRWNRWDLQRKRDKKKRVEKIKANIRKRREKKLAKDALKASGEWTPQIPKFTLTRAKTLPILLTHCENRDIEANKHQQKKPWIMCLMIHRYDKGIRDPDELNAGGLRHGLTPSPNVVRDYIQVNVRESKLDRFSIPSLKIARARIRSQNMTTFCEEAWRTMMERKIPLPIPDMKLKIAKDQSTFLNWFARAFCQAEPDGIRRKDLLATKKYDRQPEIVEMESEQNLNKDKPDEENEKA